MIRRLAVSLLVNAVILGGCASTGPERRDPGISQPIPYRWCTVEQYVIQAGDHLRVRVFDYPELTQSQEVRSDGKISILLVGDVQAAGLTPAELDASLTEAYREKIVRPEVAVIMRSFGGYKVFVGGKVRKPGEIQLQGRLTALQAIFYAGGNTEEARLGSVILVRTFGLEKSEILKLDLSLPTKTGAGDIILQPYDILFVPPTTIARVDRFVDQYLHQILPDAFYAGLQYHTDLNPVGGGEINSLR